MSSAPLFLKERRRVILEQLERLGRVSVKDLSELLNVSAVTIRQDLQALEDAAMLERTHGGAVLPKQPHPTPELSFEVRLRENKTTKEQLALKAAALVQSGDSIALDASTTVFAMMPYLKKLDRLIIVTNSLYLAQNCLNSPNIQVLMPGGMLRRDSISLVGNPNELPDINLNAGFFGAHGISPDTGLTESSMEEVIMKRSMMENCLATYCIIDERKWGKVAPFTLAAPDELTGIITTNKVPPAALQRIRDREAEVITVAI